MKPIDRMIEAIVRCYKCKKCIGDCECNDDNPDVLESLKSRRWHRELDDAFDKEIRL